jgi:hypothetical protein
MFHNQSRLLRRLTYQVFFTAAFALCAWAGTITPGAPGADGNVILDVTLPDGTVKQVTVPITKNIPRPPGKPPIPTTNVDKAKAIFAGLSAAGIPNIGYTNGNQTVVTPDKVVVVGDTTAENMVVAFSGLSLPGAPAYASLGFTGPLDPIGTDGLDSVFSASFGADGFTYSSASINYSQLPSPTPDALATAMYFELLGGLSPGLRPDLHLDLPDDVITFDYAPGSGDYFVQSSNTSPGTSQYLNVSAAPEPVTLALTGFGLILAGIAKRSSRRI